MLGLLYNIENTVSVFFESFYLFFHVLGSTSDAKPLFKTSLLKTGNFPLKLDRFNFFFGHKKVWNAQ